jgi:rod shape-determining protein MreD
MGAGMSMRPQIPWSQLTRDERWEMVLRSWRLAVPAIAILFSLYVMAWPFWLPIPLMPQLALLGVLTWVIRRPDLMRVGVAFLLGLMQDLWLGGPVGVEACLFALYAWALAGQQLVFLTRPFNFEWFVVAVLILLHQFIVWLMGLWLWSGTIDLVPLMMQGLLSALIYPAMVWIHARLQRKVVDRF